MIVSCGVRFSHRVFQIAFHLVALSIEGYNIGCTMCGYGCLLLGVPCVVVVVYYWVYHVWLRHTLPRSQCGFPTGNTNQTVKSLVYTPALETKILG